MTDVTWTNKKRRVDGLSDHKQNPRAFTAKGMKDLRESIERCGYIEPIAINTDGTILSGHARKQVLLDLGLETVDVRMPSRTLTDEEQREVLVRMNANTAGEWDNDILSAEFDSVALESWGFDTEELTEIFGESEPEEEKPAPPPPITPLVKRGDIFRLGRHRLMCGDSTDGGDVALLMDGSKADLWITDPPYGVSYANKNKALNKRDGGSRNETEIENDHLPMDEMKEVWRAAANSAALFCTDKAPYYWFACQGGDQMMMMMMMMIEADWLVRHELIWVKNNHVLGRCDYQYKHEPIIYGWKRKGTHSFYGGFQTSILEFAKPQSSESHPTMKPVALIELLIQNSSLRGETVLDTFLGSGTTLIAAERTGRTCYGIEISPRYCEVIVRRFAENCSDDNGNVDFEHVNGSLTLEEIMANVNQEAEAAA